MAKAQQSPEDKKRLAKKRQKEKESSQKRPFEAAPAAPDQMQADRSLLQSTMGNTAVGQMLANPSPAVQRTPEQQEESRQSGIQDIMNRPNTGAVQRVEEWERGRNVSRGAERGFSVGQSGRGAGQLSGNAFAGAQGGAHASASYNNVSGANAAFDIGAFVGAKADLNYTREGKLGVLSATGDAMVGALGTASGEISIGPKGISASGSAEAFVGARATASGSATILRGITISGNASATAGAGANISGTFTIQGGKIVIGGQLGATLGVGTDAGFKVEVTPSEVIDAILDIIAESTRRQLAPDAGFDPYSDAKDKTLRTINRLQAKKAMLHKSGKGKLNHQEFQKELDKSHKLQDALTVARLEANNGIREAIEQALGVNLAVRGRGQVENDPFIFQA